MADTVTISLPDGLADLFEDYAHEHGIPIEVVSTGLGTGEFEIDALGIDDVLAGFAESITTLIKASVVPDLLDREE